MHTYAKLIRVLNDREITPAQDALFLCRFQQSVLLALQESGVLTETQLRYAEARLREQQRAARGGKDD